MKRYLLSLLLLLASSLSLSAMSYREAREYAYFLTDKMAYELDLSPEQYERVYEINLDYLLSVDRRRDILGHYWGFRDMDLRYVLADWQYSRFCAADYFYRPLSWRFGNFVFNIYNRYRTRDYYYYDRPIMYRDYRGRSWASRHRNAPSPYAGFVVNGRHGGMNDYYAPSHRDGRRYRSMRNYDQEYRSETYRSAYPNESYRRYDNGARSYENSPSHNDHRYQNYQSGSRSSNESRGYSIGGSRSFDNSRGSSIGSSRSFDHSRGSSMGGSRSFDNSRSSRNFESRSNSTSAPSTPYPSESSSTSRSGVVSGRR